MWVEIRILPDGDQLRITDGVRPGGGADVHRGGQGQGRADHLANVQVSHDDVADRDRGIVNQFRVGQQARPTREREQAEHQVLAKDPTECGHRKNGKHGPLFEGHAAEGGELALDDVAVDLE